MEGWRKVGGRWQEKVEGENEEDDEGRSHIMVVKSQAMINIIHSQQISTQIKGYLEGIRFTDDGSRLLRGIHCI